MEKLPLNPNIGDRKHFAPFIYDDMIKRLILSLKYDDNGFVARAVAPYMSATLMNELPRSYSEYNLIPVPLCKTRLRRRGYNQSELLAQEITEYVNIPLIRNALFRVKKTAPQKNMTPLQRAENLKDAFAVINADLIKGKKIILVDDVYTTGATTGECVRVLRKAGAMQVKILTVAVVSNG
jgi:ComF family protein